jgi:hypothetical protein
MFYYSKLKISFSWHHLKSNGLIKTSQSPNDIIQVRGSTKMTFFWKKLSGFGHGGGALQRHLVCAPAGVHVIKHFFLRRWRCFKKTWSVLSTTTSFWTRRHLKKLARDKHSSLLGVFAGNEEKKFYNIVAWGQCYKLFIRNLRILVIS